MKPTIIIPSNPEYGKMVGNSKKYLHIAEFFCDTIQGENFVGYPATFLRLQGCTLNCSWCDSKEIWKYGNPYTFTELFSLMAKVDLPSKFEAGQHLVFTGGSPLRQQGAIVEFIHEFINRYGFKPFIEIENECTLEPMSTLIPMVDCWNNSPKLKHSGNADSMRYNKFVIQKTARLKNSWFKFVISDDNQWHEIEKDFLTPGLIDRSQIVLMPLGGTRKELKSNREKVLEICVKNNVRYSTREHVILWDIQTGV